MSAQPSLFGEQEAVRFAQEGVAIGARPVAAEVLALLQRTCEQVAARPRYLRAEFLSGIHNPFGLAAQFVDSWGLLELCQSHDLLDAVESLSGPNIVLWESELIYEPADRPPPPAPHRDPALWPMEPLCGVTVRIAIGGWGPESGGMFFVSTTDSAPRYFCRRPGDVVFHDATSRPSHHRNRSGHPRAEYIIRYMPASARFDRDPDFSPNRRAAAKAPLINYAKRPIWLVRGTDRAAML